MLNDNIKFIPIGSNCEISWYLKKINKRVEAFPFDWNCCSLSMLYNILVNDFKDFLKDIFIGTKTKRLYFDETGKNLIISNEEIYPVICKKYNVLFPHDFNNVDNITINNVREKYDRRIKKFNNIINNENVQIYLIYCNKNFKLNNWQKSAYDEYNKNILDEKNEFFLNKIKELYKDKSNIKIISLDEFKKYV